MVLRWFCCFLMEIWAEIYRNGAISGLRRSWRTIRSIDPSTNNPKSWLEPFSSSSEHSRYLYQKNYFFFPDLRIAVDPAGEIRWAIRNFSTDHSNVCWRAMGPNTSPPLLTRTSSHKTIHDIPSELISFQKPITDWIFVRKLFKVSSI